MVDLGRDGVRVFSIDPGLDVVAVARWDVPGPRDRWRYANFDTKLRCLAAVEYARTKPSDTLVARLRQVAHDTAWLVRATPASWMVVYLERPTIGGTYRRHTEKGAGPAGLTAERILYSHWALGAIAAAVVDVVTHVELVRPVETKQQRQETVRLLLRSAGRPEMRNEDGIDAIAVGLTATWDFTKL